jgi:hypothetical protein
VRSKLARLPLLALLLVAGCAPCQAPAVPALEYLGQLQLPPNSTFAGTTVGGLSGISYDPGRDCYYVISDDRSASGPARFYTVRLSVSERGVDEATITGVHPLLDVRGGALGPLDLDHSPRVVPPHP